MIRQYVRQGEPKANVARRFGVSRQTVYNHLKQPEAEATGSKPRGSKLDKYKEYLRGRLEKFDLPATVLLREIRERGYTGSVTILKEFIRPIKNKKLTKLTERFETEPGRQAQVDWGECGLIDVQGVCRRLYVFVFLLGFSRMLFVKFTTSTRRHVLQQCLQEAFQRLGIPEELLIDNMKQAVEAHTKEGVRYAREFLDFCEHYDVLPVATPPYWPRAKGKVERAVGYVKHSFLEGRSFTDVADLNRQAEQWVEAVANLRVHGTTGQVPAEAYLQERLRLRAYEAVPRFDTRPAEVRKVHLDAHVRFENVFYSVDPLAAGHSVLIKAAGEAVGELIEVFLGDQVVATHRRAPQGTLRVTLPEHGQRIRALTRAEGASIRGRRVQYTQLLPSEGLLTASPEVQTRSLELYEALLSAESLS
jgi:transposase